MKKNSIGSCASSLNFVAENGTTFVFKAYSTRSGAAFCMEAGLYTWELSELPHQTPPMPGAVACGMAFLALDSERPDISALIVLMFAGFLRTMEALILQFFRKLNLWNVVPGLFCSCPAQRPVAGNTVRSRPKYMTSPRVLSFSD